MHLLLLFTAMQKEISSLQSTKLGHILHIHNLTAALLSIPDYSLYYHWHCMVKLLIRLSYGCVLCKSMAGEQADISAGRNWDHQTGTGVGGRTSFPDFTLSCSLSERLFHY